MMEYKGYTAIVEYDPEAESFRGRIANIRDVISFYGASVEDLRREMAASIDDYLAFCEEQGVEPARPYSGRFNVRMAPEVHRMVAEAAEASGMSMNDWLVEVVERAARARGRAPKKGRRGSRRTARRPASEKKAGA